MIVRAVGISKIYGGRAPHDVEALRDVNLTVEEGEFLVISGPSGSGKTTLLNIIGGLDRPTSGYLELFRRRVDSMRDEELSKMRLMDIGFIFQDHNLLPALTVFENIELPMALAGMEARERRRRVKELLGVAGLETLSNRYPGELSVGQRQMIAILRALANRPKMILADEPTSSLDGERALTLLQFLRRSNEEMGTTIIAATTNPVRFKGFASRHLLLIEGRMMMGGPI